MLNGMNLRIKIVFIKFCLIIILIVQIIIFLMSNNKVVSYFYDSDIGLYHYANGHPMKPLRVTMTDELIQKYNLYSKLQIYVKFIIYLLFYSSRIKVLSMLMMKI